MHHWKTVNSGYHERRTLMLDRRGQKETELLAMLLQITVTLKTECSKNKNKYINKYKQKQ